MKEKTKIISLAILLIISLITLYLNMNSQKKDALKFKYEYEKLNNRETNQGKKYLNINIKNNNKIKYANFEEIKNILTNKTGVIYFGFPECPWCRNIIEPLLEAAEETNISNIYYFNAYEIRDKKYLDENNKIITEKEGTKEYEELIIIMYNELGEYEGLNDKTIKRLYFPTVVFIKNGKITNTHIGTIEEQEDPYKQLTEKQKENLKNIFKINISKIIETECNDKC